MSSVIKHPKNIISCRGKCTNCEWGEFGLKDITGKAKYHAKEKGHAVVIEQSYTCIYEGEPIPDYFSEQDKKSQEAGVVTSSLLEEIQ